jgi:hypothetical protein
LCVAVPRRQIATACRYGKGPMRAGLPLFVDAATPSFLCGEIICTGVCSRLDLPRTKTGSFPGRRCHTSRNDSVCPQAVVDVWPSSRARKTSKSYPAVQPSFDRSRQAAADARRLRRRSKSGARRTVQRRSSTALRASPRPAAATHDCAMHSEHVLRRSGGKSWRRLVLASPRQMHTPQRPLAGSLLRI